MVVIEHTWARPDGGWDCFTNPYRAGTIQFFAECTITKTTHNVYLSWGERAGFGRLSKIFLVQTNRVYEQHRDYGLHLVWKDPE